ncbi:MAG: tripartite tricarboxylate transporter TctB family protein, partial [Kiritimatiellae bacterium]|nr:tripartite tricarboxylate transporter TctB family protein [Kiritimatiellia bacterium]
MKPGEKNFILGLLLSVFFWFTYIVLIPVAVYIPENVVEAGMSPASWPRLVTSLIAILGIGLAIQGALQIKRDRTADVTKRHDDKRGKTTNYLKIFAVMAALLIYYWV